MNKPQLVQLGLTYIHVSKCGAWYYLYCVEIVL